MQPQHITGDLCVVVACGLFYSRLRKVAVEVLRGRLIAEPVKGVKVLF
jgi:hypothetical protein